MIFKDEAKEEGVSIIDFIYRAVQVLKENLYWIKISTQNTGLIKLVKL